MSDEAGGIGRLWRTLRPLPVGTHGWRALNEVRQRTWGAVLPLLVLTWHQQGAARAPKAKAEALLALGAVLNAAPPPPSTGLVDGRFVLSGREVSAFPPPDWQLPGARPLERYEADYLGWADALVAAATANGDRAALALCQQALDGWQQASRRLDKAWEPYPRARRCLATLQAAARLTVMAHHGRDRIDPAHQALRDRLLVVAGAAAAGLDSLAERHLDGNHLLVDRIAAAAAEAVFGTGESALVAAVTEAERQFPRDGGHVEAAPMYHALLIEDLLVLRGLLGARRPVRQRLDAVLARATAWLAAVRHPDGQLPAFGDTDPRVLQNLPLTRTAVSRTPPGVTDPWQSAWISRRGGDLAIVHTAPPAWDPQPGHAHADHLSVEWSWRDRRVLADAGLAGYEGDPHLSLIHI